MEGKFDRQKLILYLLGSLSDSEAEQFDELSITSDEFNDALNGAESDLVDDYISGSLDGEMLNKFRTNYLATSIRRDRVNFARVLQASGLAITDSELPVTKTRTEDEGFFPALAQFFSGQRFVFGAAFLLLIVIGGIWLTIIRKPDPEKAFQNLPPVNTSTANQNSSPSDKEVALGNTEVTGPNVNGANSLRPDVDPKTPVQTPTPTRPKISIATFVLAPPVRGGSPLPSFTISPETSDLLFRLQLEPNAARNYRVTLTDESGRHLWKSSSLRAAGTGNERTVTTRFPTKLVKTGVYSLLLTGDNEPIGDYSFRLVKAVD